MKKILWIPIVALVALVVTVIAEDRTAETIRYRVGSWLKFDPNSGIKDEDGEWTLTWAKLQKLEILSTNTAGSVLSATRASYVTTSPLTNSISGTSSVSAYVTGTLSNNITGSAAYVTGTLSNNITGSARYVTTNPLTNSVAGLNLVTNEVISIVTTNGDGTISGLKTNTIISGVLGGGYADTATNAIYVTTSPLTNSISGTAAYVSGTLTNSISGTAAYVSGTLTNSISGVASYVSGTLTNSISGNAAGATNWYGTGFTGALTVVTNGANTATLAITNGLIISISAP